MPICEWECYGYKCSQLDIASGVFPSLFHATLRLPLVSTQSGARLTNTKQAQLPSEERVGDVLRDSEEVLAVYSSDAVKLEQPTRHTGMTT